MSITSREPCGCQHGTNSASREWIKFCAEHQAEHDALRARWQADYRRLQDAAASELT